MNGVVLELEETLHRLDAPSAAALEQVVRGALALAAKRSAPVRNGPTPAEAGVDANGYPNGYFEMTAGSFANEPFDVAEDPPPEPPPKW